MVPIADLFNHTDLHNVNVEAEDNICLHCGLLHDGPCETVDSATTDTIDVRSIEFLEPGEEAINTYGELSNAELLCQYGFSLDSKTVFERCSWGPELDYDRCELEQALMHVVSYTPSNDTHKLNLTQVLVNLDWLNAKGQVNNDNKDRLGPALMADDLAFVPLQLPRDRQRPLFVDAMGKPSWCLWRFFLGACLACSVAPITGWSLLLNQVQVCARAIEAEHAKPTEATALAKQCLKRLYTIRIKKLYASEHEEEALLYLVRAFLIQTHRGVLRSVVQLALQESDILQHALSHVT